MSTKSLYVGNLSYSTTAEALNSSFSEWGGTNARIVEGRGFGFVDVDADKMEDAIAARDQSTIDGRKVFVNEARPREPRAGGGGGGGGYGGGGRSGGGGGGYGGGGRSGGGGYGGGGGRGGGGGGRGRDRGGDRW